MGGNKGFGAVPKGQKFKPGTIKRLMSYLKEYKVRLTVVVICILISAGASVAASLFLQTLIDDYIGPLLLEAPPNFGGLLQAILGISVVFLAGILASLFYARTMAVIAQSTLKNIRDEMFTKMQTLPIRYFDTRTHGDIMSYYTNDADTLRQMISQSLPNLFSSVVSMIAVLISMIHLSIWLTLIVLVFTAVILMVIKAIAGRSGNFFMKQQRSIADVNGYIEEMVNGQKVVKVFCYEEKAKERFKEKNENLGNTTAMANTLANILMPVTGGLGYVLYVLIAVAGGAMGIAGVTNLSIGGEEFLTLGTIASFLTLSRNFVNPIAQVSQQLNSVIMAMAGASRIFELLDQEPEEDRGTVTLVNAYEDESGQLKECEKRTGTWAWKDGDKLIPMRGKINLKEVDFGYNEDELVLHDITIYAEPGQKVALVGATGAGKTTITNLINRFYDIDDGKIQYDGININRIRKYDLRRSLGVVLQEVNLFTGTVMDNIRYGKLDATDEECIAAAKLANADGFIRMLPDGYDTVLSGDGSGLSQGQRQLISIARAAVADPPVMILDEATSSIDTRTESIVQRGMDNLMHGRTVFVIAHRLSTIQNADVIMVMDQGRIIERGNHEHLIEEKGRYYQLYTGAFELE
ncbi:MAG: ABC transporter ATP-binding protein [Firmicutes bacterium]|jgi:multidrug ABC transporter, permease/ATP-binding protein|uniref:ABC transporter ATP-binding protein n=1 Tax=Candidatus Fimenecus sp. TaxID=3022888 RepID=UPI001EDD376F|nr:ABC transporter ATP-binding protein [Bacillota bacterium]MCG4733326.1 ABC transporter ATP-binding protein/permease [Casaltella massiliensis]